MLVQARLDKETTNPELLTSRRCRLVVVAVETGWRWSDDAADFLWHFALAKAREVPALLTQSATLAWGRRWTRMLGTACAVAFALTHGVRKGGDTPALAEPWSHDPRQWKVVTHRE